MELHQLRYAIEIHRRGSFTSAADVLHVSQSGISAQVAKLERELGVRLFDRGSRTAKPTTEGTALLPLMASALTEVARIEEVTGELLGLVRGAVRIGTVIGCTIPSYLNAFAEFRTTYPGVRVSASEGNSTDLIARLLTGDLDIAVLAHAGTLPTELDTTTFIDEPVAVGVPARHEWEKRSRITAAELAEADVLTLAEGTGIRAALQQTCYAAGVDLSPAIEAYSPETVHTLAARGVGIAVLAASMITGPLTAVAVQDAAHTQLSLASRKHLGIAARTFVQTLNAHFSFT